MTNKIHRKAFSYSAIALAVSVNFLPNVAVAQDEEAQIETIQITATRRTGTVQDAPLNITALTSDTLAEQNISDLDDVARWVPGLTVTDQGGRNDSPIIVRGLNTNSSGPGSDGGTVATYVGEIPLFINLRLNDIERVEVLIGPQGTLYGAGTLGGAIRYIPKQVELDVTEGQVYGDLFSQTESSSLGGEAGFVFNTPLIEDELGVRVSVNKFHNPGFIDYNYVVREGGVSLPDPDWTDQTAIDENLKQVKDANGEDTLTAKVALRWKPNDKFDATLSYFYQNQEVEGRSITHYGALSEDNPLSGLIGKYESAYRYVEPREKEDSLLSLEMKVDLGFADLVSATGKSQYNALGQRDQTDLLIRLDYSYEEFPAFSAYTREVDEVDVLTQELRLVSKGDSALSWIVGGFYNNVESFGESSEFAPGFDEYAINVWGVDGNLRPDSLEYYSVGYTDTTEKALFGELSYQINEKWDVTFGMRKYAYDVTSSSAVDLPLFYTVFEGRDPDSLEIDLSTEKADDSGDLFKFNTSYQFTDDLMGYFTVSEGFRIGGSNGVAACPDNVDEIATQIVCALPDEVLFTPDTTTNYELGFKSTWLKNKFHFNAALFNVDWDNAQVSGATVNGQQTITSNAATANAKGIEISSRAIISDSFSAYATYSYTEAKLTNDALFLFDSFVDDEGEVILPIQNNYDGKDGDRLPGSPEQQFSLGLKYTQDIFSDKLLDITYGFTAQSDVFTKVGLRADGEALPGYGLSNISASISDDDWVVTLYVDNVFNKYAFSSTRSDVSSIGLGDFQDENFVNGTDLLRSYGHYLINPRKVGVKFTYNFEM
ncbi:TonB-dependent receptor [Paraglaciecola sp. 2405UD69-4]|uniref:TonB-dependent receptor n=1 Tax=Paraglaciecola sp. 2405UD69-4 TaxID=3391836 RepID=UPI0039C9E559